MGLGSRPHNQGRPGQATAQHPLLGVQLIRSAGLLVHSISMVNLKTQPEAMCVSVPGCGSTFCILIINLKTQSRECTLSECYTFNQLHLRSAEVLEYFPQRF